MANKNSVNVAAINEYVEENINMLLVCANLEGRTLNYVTIQKGIKNKEKLRKIAVTAALSNFTSDWDTDAEISDVTLSDVEIKVGEVEYKFSQGVNEFNQIKEGLLLSGSNNEDIPYEAQIVSYLIVSLHDLLEILYWQGDESSGNPALNRFDGFIKQIDNAPQSPVIVSNYDLTTGVGVYNTLIKMADARPTNILQKKNNLFIGYDKFNLLISYLVNANLIHFNITENDFTMTLPGRNIQVVAIKGLDGTDRFILTYPENMYVGLDMMNEEEELKVWYNQDLDKVRMRGKGKKGTQVVCGGDIVINWGVVSGSGIGSVNNGSNIGI